MENCLVTKLKGVVDNDNLDVYGFFKVKIQGNNTAMQYRCLAGAQMRADKPITVYKPDNTLVASNVMAVVFPETNFYKIDGIGNLEVNFMYDKYKSINFTTYDMSNGNAKNVILDINDLKYILPESSAHLAINAGADNSTINGSVSLSDFEYKDDLRAFNVRNKYSNTDNLQIDINNFSSSSLLTLNIPYNSAICNIATFNAPNLIQLNIVGCVGFTGDLHVMAENMRLAGRTSGECTINIIDNQGHWAGGSENGITWGGVPLHQVEGSGYNPKIVFGADSVSLVAR